MNISLKQMDIKALLNKKLKASITVEAAFSFTLTIFILFMMLGPLIIIKTSSDLLINMNEASKVRVNYEGIKYQSKETKIYQKIAGYVDDNEFLKDNIKNIENIVNYGLVLAKYSDEYDESKSEYKNIKYVYDINDKVYDEDTGVVKLDYEICFKMPYNVLHIKEVHKRLLINRRAFIGSDGNRFDNMADGGEYIYLADNYINSRKYHTYINCTYLKKNTISYKYSEIGSKRNVNNHKYSRCSYCFKNIKINDGIKCYITEYGELYHYKSNCPLMTAYVTKKPKDFAEKNNLSLCSRCEEKEMEEGK